MKEIYAELIRQIGELQREVEALRAIESGGGGATGLSGKIEIGIDGHGSAPAIGILADFIVPFNLVVSDWTLIADQAGSIVVDLWKDIYTNYPPTVGDSVTGGAKPTLSSQSKNTANISGWTAAWSAGDVIRINVDSADTLRRATLSLSYTRS